VITSGTPAMPHALNFAPFGEGEFVHRVSPGTIVYNDRSSLVGCRTMRFLAAALVLSTVVSRVREDRVTLRRLGLYLRRSHPRDDDTRPAAAPLDNHQHPQRELSVRGPRKAGLFPRPEEETRPAPVPPHKTFQNGPRRPWSAAPRKTSAPLTVPGRSGDAC